MGKLVDNYAVGSKITELELQEIGVEYFDMGDWMEAVTAGGAVWRSVSNSGKYEKVKKGKVAK